ncbi:MAG: 2-succinyl-5-enolpyruvyl-6-hydroxy-3-cyclohexene-1-carboxylic-acid synthase [Promicromonosporaceae bacterium]|nr:2-succinyl-5-enolpyruvyl-6-hydroxy-3-cyclohexene-1-carboxylic-acid synthase [Promicromonosporaceae bacterium]
MSHAVAAARALVAELSAQGVRDVVLAPGSRSAPLAYALADADATGLVRLHVRVDERAAGFLALGLAKGDPAGPRPVAVVTTSGTAVANLHPAVLEAHHTGVPLVLLTADRPHELRGTGASQTTDQVGVFGTAVRFAADVPAPDGRDGEVRDLLSTTGRALAAALGLRDRNPGPVHLNLAYRDPLQPEVAHGETPADGVVSTSSTTTGHRTVVVPPVPGPGADPVILGDAARTLVVAGDGAGPQARALAEVQGWPLLAEPSSGACGGPVAIRAYRSLLGVEELARDVENVVVLGHPTLSRPVQRLLGRPDVAVTVVAPGGGPWPDAARNAMAVVDALHDRWFAERAHGDSSFLERWLTVSRAAERVLDRVTTAEGALAEASFAALAVARAVAAASAPGDVLVVGSSNPVRDLDLVLGMDAAPARVIANRGLAGIDGTVSTAAGIALAAAPARTRALLGDLTFLHDIGGLLRGPLEPAAPLQLVVVNDDGGSIFATLEHGALAAQSAERARTFERVFGTPHGADLAALCAGYGVAHREATTLAALRAALADPAPGVEVVEVRVARDERLAESRALHAEIVSAARSAGKMGHFAPER